MTDRTPKKREWKAVFLEHLGKTGNVSASAKKAGISRGHAYASREDEEFAVAWDEAIEEGVDDLEGEARRRARKGVLKPVFYKGEKVGTVREYSDTLLIFLLKGRRPDVYGDRVKQEVTGAGGGPIEVIEVVGGSDGDREEEGAISWP